VVSVVGSFADVLGRSQSSAYGARWAVAPAPLLT
jgi:hypothetical protein